MSESNLARQCFCEADIGGNKAFILAQRARSFFGIPIEAKDVKWWDSGDASIVVSCVDTLATRRQIAAGRKDRYYLDLGNSDNAGQVVLGGHGLPNLFEVYPHLKRARDPKDIPSCSMAESLARQDLFINPTLAALGGHLIWRLMRSGGLNHHGYVVNLSAGLVLPLVIQPK